MYEQPLHAVLIFLRARTTNVVGPDQFRLEAGAVEVQRLANRVPQDVEEEIEEGRDEILGFELGGVVAADFVGGGREGVENEMPSEEVGANRRGKLQKSIVGKVFHLGCVEEEGKKFSGKLRICSKLAWNIINGIGLAFVLQEHIECDLFLGGRYCSMQNTKRR